MTRREFLAEIFEECLNHLDKYDDMEYIPEAIKLQIDWTNDSTDTFKIVITDRPQIN